MKKSTPEQIAEGLNKVKKAIDKFNSNFKDSMPDDLALFCVIALIKDRGIFIEKVKFETQELGINITSIEKHVIHKSLADKYKAKDKEEQKEIKRLIKKQVKQIKNGRRRSTK